MVERAREVGYVTTIFGRRRYLNDIASRNAVARGLAERNAVNAPIQGSAADIMKIAMVHIAEAFRREGIRSQMILQVHDEVVIDTLRSELDRVREIVTEAMEQAGTLGGDAELPLNAVWARTGSMHIDPAVYVRHPLLR